MPQQSQPRSSAIRTTDEGRKRLDRVRTLQGVSGTQLIDRMLRGYENAILQALDEEETRSYFEGTLQFDAYLLARRRTEKLEQ
jgi:hypothetical protein